MPRFGPTFLTDNQPMKERPIRETMLRWGRGGPKRAVMTALMLFSGLMAAAEQRLVTTVGMVTDLARAVAGERWEVVGLIGEGVDPHLFKPNRRTLIEVQRADLIIYNGFHLEGRMTEIFDRLRESGTPTLALAEQIVESGAIPPLTDGGRTDPHVWMDVAAWRSGLAVIAAFMAQHDPAEADAYHRRAAERARELEIVEAYGRAVLGTVPEDRRVLVTAHDAFAYFGRAYHFEVRGIQGVSTESESGLKELEALVDLIVERRIPAIFAESSVSEKNVRALMEGAAARGHALGFGGVLYSDAMGAAGTYAGTYVGMIDHNFTTIAEALGGQVPYGGMRSWMEAEQ